MPDINFLEIFHSKQDKETLKNMVDEITNLYGFPCVLKRWTGIQTQLDPLYSDQLTSFQNDSDLYDPINTHIYIGWTKLNQTLHSYGLAFDENISLEGFMSLDDQPKENDIITIKLPYDDVLLTLKIGGTYVHTDICYGVTLQIAHFEQLNVKGS